MKLSILFGIFFVYVVSGQSYESGEGCGSPGGNGSHGDDYFGTLGMLGKQSIIYLLKGVIQYTIDNSGCGLTTSSSGMFS